MMVINLFGGPGIGKSTLAADIFVMYKKRGIYSEYIHEYAKDLIYEDRTKTFRNQFYIMSKQHHRLWKIVDYIRENKIDGYIVMDSPIILGLVYTQNRDNHFKHFEKFIVNEFKSMNNINILLERDGEGYEESGRNETFEQALEKDREVKDLLDKNDIEYISLKRDRVIDYLKERL